MPMKYKAMPNHFDTYTMSSGRVITSYNGVLGIDANLEELHTGFDEGTESLKEWTAEERKELAVQAISMWMNAGDLCFDDILKLPCP